MIVTNQARFVNGKMVWDRAPTEEEKAADAARFAEMCQARQATPMLGSERAFLADIGLRDHGLGDHPIWQQQMLIQQAKKAGINIEGKRYFGGIADGRGVADPEAWCSTQQDVLDTAKRRDLLVHSGSGVGGVNYDSGSKPPPPTPIDLAPDIVARLDKQYVQDPKYAKMSKQERAEMIVHKHGRRKKSNAPPIKEWKPNAEWKDIGDS